MNLSLSKKLLVVVALLLPLSGAVIGYGPMGVAQEKPAKKKEDAKPKGRLPAYYSDVVTEEQRTKIYEIQAKFAKEIGDLNAQLKALEEKLDAEVEAVLSAEQKAKVEAARTAASKKKKPAEPEKKPETK